jgi:short-subunit dehydrogenase
VKCFDLKTRANARKARKYKGRIEVVWGDLRRPADVASAVEGQDVVIHLAFIIPKLSATGVECEEQPEWAREINVGGTRNLLNAMNALPRPPKLVFSSSLHVFGRTQDQAPPRTVSDPVQPIEHYARHKIQCEHMVKASGLDWTILRFGAVLPLALRADPGMFDVPLNNRIEFVHTRDVGLALANAASSTEVWGKILLIGGGPDSQFRFGDMAERLLKAMGVGMLPEQAFGKTPFCTDWLDTTESQRILGYQKHRFEDYVKSMTAMMGFKRHLVRAFRPIVRFALLKKSPYYAQARSALAWRGKVALVTGASSGIGAETAKQLALRGLKVVLVARREERLEEVAEEIRLAGGETLVLSADLTDERECLRVVDQTRSAFGPVDVLVNNAGLGWYGFGEEMPWAMALQMMQVNVAAVVRLTLLLLPEMKARNSGHILNIGSISGSLPSPGAALYSATKSFIDTFSIALQRELKGTNVRISVLRPGAVSTEFFDQVAGQPTGLPLPVRRSRITAGAIAGRIWSLLNRPRRVAYVPRLLSFIPWIEFFLGWIIDRLGPILLRRHKKRGQDSVKA